MPAKKPVKPARRRKPASRGVRRTTAKKPVRAMPVWLRNGLAVCIAAIFFVGFYWFFIRPYAYRWKPCSNNRQEYGVCMPQGYEVHGIDISHYQGDIDWAALAQCKEGLFPIRFVFMKATEGGDHGDDRFMRNFESARQYGFIRGAYHYFIPQTDADKQADFFISRVQLAAGDLPPVLDVESLGRKSLRELKHGVKKWLDRVEEHYGVKPILYTSYKFRKDYLNDSIFDIYPYWIAHYYVDSVRYKGRWHFWQHTDVGNVPGIVEPVDLNVFNGTLPELREMVLP